MKKADKGVLAQPPPPAGHRLLLPPRAAGPVRGGEAHRSRIRYTSLLRDFQELAKETQAKKDRLHMEKLKKQRLLAEVKFLRRRYKLMSENPSQTVVHRVKNPAMTPTLQTTMLDRSDVHHSIQAFRSSSIGPYAQQGRQNFSPRVYPLIDLNKACEPSSEETEEFHGYPEPACADKSNKYLLLGDLSAGPSKMKMPGFWDAHSMAVRAGKRKISWQDQFALRVYV